MEFQNKIEDYHRDKGIQLKWDEGFRIKVKQKADHLIITANKEGLISLARHLLTLAQDTVENGSHIHLDEYNSLEEGSAELVIEKWYT